MRTILAVLVALVVLVCSAGMVGAVSPVQSDQLMGQSISSVVGDGPLLQTISYKTITLGQSFYSSWRWYCYPSGAPATGKYATLQSSYNGGSWTTIAGRTTNSNGVVGWTIKPPAVGDYRYRTTIGSVVTADILSVTVNRVGAPRPSASQIFRPHPPTEGRRCWCGSRTSPRPLRPRGVGSSGTAPSRPHGTLPITIPGPGPARSG